MTYSCANRPLLPPASERFTPRCNYDRRERDAGCNGCRFRRENEDGDMNDWRNQVAPSHKCTVCGALWRYWPSRDTIHIDQDTWSLRSPACGPCCDNVAMGAQIVPLTMEDMEQYLRRKVVGPDPLEICKR